YCTDVYQNEPEINPDIIQHATLCTPHIAGHSIEAKSHAVLHLTQLLHAHFNFNMPQPIQIQTTKPPHSYKSRAWEKSILNLYTPLIETQALKQASDSKATFLGLRRAHTHRHHFNWA
ncbi:MAG: 4-phosphoerythronate dehydrogenase, partial [Gammaproteobacteria bacterium]|nr:4-phosphoerythronate dehydrogenase [Gammaproteobacteria bacterium]